MAKYDSNFKAQLSVETISGKKYISLNKNKVKRGLLLWGVMLFMLFFQWKIIGFEPISADRIQKLANWDTFNQDIDFVMLNIILPILFFIVGLSLIAYDKLIIKDDNTNSIYLQKKFFFYKFTPKLIGRNDTLMLLMEHKYNPWEKFRQVQPLYQIWLTPNITENEINSNNFKTIKFADNYVFTKEDATSFIRILGLKFIEVKGDPIGMVKTFTDMSGKEEMEVSKKIYCGGAFLGLNISPIILIILTLVSGFLPLVSIILSTFIIITALIIKRRYKEKEDLNVKIIRYIIIVNIIIVAINLLLVSGVWYLISNPVLKNG